MFSTLALGQRELGEIAMGLTIVGGMPGAVDETVTRGFHKGWLDPAYLLHDLIIGWVSCRKCWVD